MLTHFQHHSKKLFTRLTADLALFTWLRADWLYEKSRNIPPDSPILRLPLITGTWVQSEVIGIVISIKIYVLFYSYSDSEGLVKLWTIKTSECVKTLDEHTDKVS